MMKYAINRVAVIGSGVMGSRIAAHLANIGIQTIMLDIVPNELTAAEKKAGLSIADRVVRNRIAIQHKQELMKQKPSPLTVKASLDLIEVGNLKDDLARIGEADWIIEVVTERLSIKKEILSIIEKHRKPGSIVSSNTSGISIEAMVSDCSTEFRTHFLGTHFFNPPRYLKLLEVIPTKDTDPDVLVFMKSFGRDVLGKGVVEAKDTPNFIANRIGAYGLLVTIKEMLKRGLSIGEVDSVTGPLIGRPKSATFRTLDVVGLDTFIHATKNVHDQVKGREKDVFNVPEFMLKMAENNWLGAKTNQGFYQKRQEKNQRMIYELDPNTLHYIERKKLITPAVEMSKQAKGTSERVKTLIHAKGDLAGDFVWEIIKPVLIYAANLAYEIADDLQSIDQAMCWGFGWKLGPFQLWDAIGVKESVRRMEAEGDLVPDWVLTLIEDGNDQFYRTKNNQQYYYKNRAYEPVRIDQKNIHLKQLKATNGVIRKNAGASMIDLGDGVLGLEFHSKSNAIGLDIIQMINLSIEEASKNYEGLVIGNQGKNFCVGANLALMLMEAQDDNFFELDMVIRQFQNMTMNIKYSEKPVVVAPFQMTLGGGAEVALPAASIQASAETYIGLVEFGVGLIPGGGGTKELYVKQIRDLPSGIDFDFIKIANDVFEKVAMAKVSSSAAEGREYGYLNNQDGISINGDHLLYDAKQRVLSLARVGYHAPRREKIPVVGESGYAAMLLGAKTLHVGGYASDHDVKIAEKLAYVLSGGRIKEGTLIDEQVMLDLEREAFLSLIGEPLTQMRMQHMLLKGKPLRN